PRALRVGSRRWSRGRTGTTRGASVRLGVVDLEVVELPRGAVAAEVRGVEVVEAGAVEQGLELGDVVLAELFLDAVGAEARDGAAHVDVRFVDRVAERVSGIAADDEATALCHEGAHVADGAADDDVDAFHRDAAARGRVAAHDEEAAAPGRARRLAGVPV